MDDDKININSLDIALMLNAGLKPRYKAFAYIVYLVCECDHEKITRMKSRDLLQLISEKYNVDTDTANSNLKFLVKACLNYGDSSSPLAQLFVDSKYDMPSPCEFVTGLICYMRLAKLTLKDELFMFNSAIESTPVSNPSVNDGIKNH